MARQQQSLPTLPPYLQKSKQASRRQLSNQWLSLGEAFTICSRGAKARPCQCKKQTMTTFNTQGQPPKGFDSVEKTNTNHDSFLGRKDNQNVIINIYFQNS